LRVDLRVCQQRATGELARFVVPHGGSRRATSDSLELGAWFAHTHGPDDLTRLPKASEECAHINSQLVYEPGLSSVKRSPPPTSGPTPFIYALQSSSLAAGFVLTKIE
jgi:hypothetical protein